MNENLNLVEILKDCPEGTKLYSPLYGDVELVAVSQDDVTRPIVIKIRKNSTDLFWTDSFTKDGRIFAEFSGECILLPSKDQRDWSKFKVKSNKPKFEPNTLKPFDKVLVRDSSVYEWRCALYSHTKENEEYKYVTLDCNWKCCIPYNDDTKHLVGTTDEAPEYYRY